MGICITILPQFPESNSDFIEKLEHRRQMNPQFLLRPSLLNFLFSPTVCCALAVLRSCSDAVFGFFIVVLSVCIYN
jgi:hypothetical protein